MEQRLWYVYLYILLQLLQAFVYSRHSRIVLIWSFTKTKIDKIIIKRKWNCHIYYGQLNSNNKLLLSMALRILQRIQFEIISVSFQNTRSSSPWATIPLFSNLSSTPTLLHYSKLNSYGSPRSSKQWKISITFWAFSFTIQPSLHSFQSYFEFQDPYAFKNKCQTV